LAHSLGGWVVFHVSPSVVDPKSLISFAPP
jgi:hypothetical protein